MIFHPLLSLYNKNNSSNFHLSKKASSCVGDIRFFIFSHSSFLTLLKVGKLLGSHVFLIIFSYLISHSPNMHKLKKTFQLNWCKVDFDLIKNHSQSYFLTLMLTCEDEKMKTNWFTKCFRLSFNFNPSPNFTPTFIQFCWSIFLFA